MKKFGWHIIHRFDGNPDWQELNRLIQFDSGVEEPYCETEADYQQAVREGWIKFDGKETTVWADGEYEEEADTMTIEELAQNWMENDRTGDYYGREITLDEAKDLVSYMDPDVLADLDEQITPEKFMDAWNSLV